MAKEDFTPKQLNVLQQLTSDIKRGVLFIFNEPLEAKEIIFEEDLNPNIMNHEDVDEVLTGLYQDVEDFEKTLDLDTCHIAVLTGLRANLANYELFQSTPEWSEVHVILELTYNKRKEELNG